MYDHPSLCTLRNSHRVLRSGDRGATRGELPGQRGRRAGSLAVSRRASAPAAADPVALLSRSAVAATMAGTPMSPPGAGLPAAPIARLH